MKNLGKSLDVTGQNKNKVEKNSENDDEDQEAELLRLDAEIRRAVRSLDHWLLKLRSGGEDSGGKA